MMNVLNAVFLLFCFYTQWGGSSQFRRRCEAALFFNDNRVDES